MMHTSQELQISLHDKLHIAAWLLHALRQQTVDGEPLLGQSLIIKQLADRLWNEQ